MRPFTKPLQLSAETSEPLAALKDNIDGRGNNLHEFAEDLFYRGIADGITWILVDQPSGVPEGATVADERRMGVRPYWRHYLASDVLAVYSKFKEPGTDTPADGVAGVKSAVTADAGIEVLTEIRLRETTIERDGFDEKEVQRVRIFRLNDQDRPEWELWRKREQNDAAADGSKWFIETGPHALPISQIPLVPVIFGKRDGMSWRIDPPLRDAAYLQIELYQQENGLKNIRNLTAYAMLAGQGIDPDIGEDGQPKNMIIGPNTVLYGGRSESGGGKWEFVEPGGASLNFLREDIKDTITELRELGRQPLITPAPNITAVSASSAAQTSNTAAQAWVASLADALSVAGMITAEWMDLSDAKFEADIHSDFDVGYGADDIGHLITLATGEYPLISREAALAEFQRRGVLAPSFDAEADLEKLGGGGEEEP